MSSRTTTDLSDLTLSTKILQDINFVDAIKLETNQLSENKNHKLFTLSVLNRDELPGADVPEADYDLYYKTYDVYMPLTNGNGDIVDFNIELTSHIDESRGETDHYDKIATFAIKTKVSDNSNNNESQEGGEEQSSEDITTVKIYAPITSCYVVSRLTDLTSQYNSGDIAIVSAYIDESKSLISRTAYFYNRSLADWVAMDGNYDASNVYFNNDLTFTEQFGKYPANFTGYTISSKGKNLIQFLRDAFYISETYTVTFRSNVNEGTIDGGNTVDNYSILTCEVNRGSNVDAPIVFPEDHWIFNDIWFNENNDEVDFTTTQITANTTFTAQFIKMHTVTFRTDKNKGIITGGNTVGNYSILTYEVENGQYATSYRPTTVTITDSNSYNFVNNNSNWIIDGTAKNLANTQITADTIFDAKFINKYTVQFVIDSSKGSRTGGGALTQYIEHGQSATAPIVEGNENWQFNSWNTSFSNVTSDLTVNAVFTEVQQELPKYWGYRLGNPDNPGDTSNNIKLNAITSNDILYNMNENHGTEFPSSCTYPINTKQLIFVAPHDSWKKKIVAKDELGSTVDFANSNGRVVDKLVMPGKNGETIEYDIWHKTFTQLLAGTTNILTFTWINE